MILSEKTELELLTRILELYDKDYELCVKFRELGMESEGFFNADYLVDVFFEGFSEDVRYGIEWGDILYDVDRKPRVRATQCIKALEEKKNVM